jgi:hypothetical protein
MWPYSLMKLGCYIFFLFSLLIFLDVIRFPCFTYPEPNMYKVRLDSLNNALDSTGKPE